MSNKLIAAASASFRLLRDTEKALQMKRVASYWQNTNIQHIPI